LEELAAFARPGDADAPKTDREGIVNHDPIDTLFRQVRLDPFHRSERIIDFHDQLPVPIIMKLDDDGVRGVVHVPKDTLPMLVKLARCDNAGKLRTYEPDAMPPPAGSVRIIAHITDVAEWNVQFSLERPQPVQAFDFEV